MPRVTEQVSNRNEKSLGTGILCPASSAPKLMVVAQEVETFYFQTLQHSLPTRSLIGDQRGPCKQELGKKIPQAPSSPQLEPERAEVKSRAGNPGPRAQRDKPLATEVSQEKSNHRVDQPGTQLSLLVCCALGFNPWSENSDPASCAVRRKVCL